MDKYRFMRCLSLVSLFAIVLLNACPSAGRMAYQTAQKNFQEGDYAQALANYEKALEAEQESVMALFGKARCLYELERYSEAMPLFEEFLQKTDTDRVVYSDERFDAEFYRDKCKLELGMEVPQDPSKIPPPRMGE